MINTLSSTINTTCTPMRPPAYDVENNKYGGGYAWVMLGENNRYTPTV